MLAFSFTIHPWIVQGIVGSVGLTILYFLVIRPAIKRTKSLKIRIAESKKREQDIEKSQERARLVQERARLVEAFPQPWLDLWDDCKKLKEHKPRAIRLEGWLEQLQKLPPLSMEAIEELAAMVAKSSTDSDFVAALKALSPYTAKQQGILAKQQEILREKLPSKWYQLCTELQNYSEARSLFLQKTDPSLGGRHPCCYISLSTEQATLLANALGKNESDRGFYAHDLAKFIVLESECRDGPSTQKRIEAMAKHGAKAKRYVCIPCNGLFPEIEMKEIDGKLVCSRCRLAETDSIPAKKEWKHHHSPKCPVCQADMKIFTSKVAPHDGEKYLQCSNHQHCLGVREYKEWERQCMEWDREVIEDAETVPSSSYNNVRKIT